MITYKWRYKNTLRLNFRHPIGITSGNTVDLGEVVKFIEYYGITTTPSNIFNSTNNFIKIYFKSNLIDIDWRDSFELEIHLKEEVFIEDFIDRLEEFLENTNVKF